jgi:ketosteroid isomerase-like protein
MPTVPRPSKPLVYRGKTDAGSDTGQLMSQANVEIVRRVYQFWDHRDWSKIPELFAPEIELDLSRNVFNPAVYNGHGGLETYLSAVDEIWDDFRVVPAEFVGGGDVVVTAVTLHGRGKESGVDVEMQLFNVWTLRDSKVVRIVGGYRDRSEALKAAGLPERD